MIPLAYPPSGVVMAIERMVIPYHFLSSFLARRVHILDSNWPKEMYMCKSNKIQDKYKFRLVYMSCTCTTYMYVPTIKPSTFYHFHLFVWIRTIMYTCACTPVCGTLCVCVVHTDTVPGEEKGQISYMCTKNDLVLGTQYALRSLTKSLTKSFIDCHLMIYVGYLNCTYIQVRYRSTGM